MDKEKWNNRYSEANFAYGKSPNLFFQQWLPQFKPARILMPADGEGRNGVYAATLGWQVTSFDLSVAGKTKALHLAQAQNVELEYIVGDFANIDFDKESFDAIGLIYAHFPATHKAAFHQKLHEYLKPGGVVIFEGFSKKHLPFKQANPNVGGPGDMDVAFSIEELKAFFPAYETEVLEETIVDLEEGKYHKGKGSVVRFIGKKPH